jgi:hypothetical protein
MTNHELADQSACENASLPGRSRPSSRSHLDGDPLLLFWLSEVTALERFGGTGTLEGRNNHHCVRAIRISDLEW